MWAGIWFILLGFQHIQAPKSDSPDTGKSTIKGMKNDLLAKLENVDFGKLDLSSLPEKEREKAKKTLELFQGIQDIKLKSDDDSGTLLQKIIKTQTLWQEAKTIFSSNLNLTHIEGRVKPNQEIISNLKNLLTEVDSSNPENDAVAEHTKIKATLAAFKKKIGISEKALLPPETPKTGQADVNAATITNNETKPDEAEVKEKLASAVEYLSEDIDAYFAKSIARLSKEVGRDGRRRRKRGVKHWMTKFVYMLGHIILAIIMWLAAVLVCFSGVGTVIWFAKYQHGYHTSEYHKFCMEIGVGFVKWFADKF